MLRDLTREREVSAVLLDGTVVTLRPLAVTDRSEFAAFLGRLSPDARRTRFFVALPEVGPRLVRDLIEVDQCRHLLWGAFVGDRCVGEVRSVRTSDDPSTAEVAFAVSDDLRRVGLGRLLVETISVAAASTGISTLVASVMPDNPASNRLLAQFGMRFRFADGALQGSCPVPPWTRDAALVDRIVALQRAAANAHVGVAA